VARGGGALGTRPHRLSLVSRYECRASHDRLGAIG